MSAAKLFAFHFIPFFSKPAARAVRYPVIQQLERLRAKAIWNSRSLQQTASNEVTVPSTLLVATHDDRASISMAHALLEHGDLWEPVQNTAIVGDVWQSKGSSVYLWIRTDSMLHHDFIDEAFTSHTGIELTDMIFISRHQSSSGSPALTVHPIGNPGPFFYSASAVSS